MFLIRIEGTEIAETRVIQGVIFDLGSTLIRFDGDWLDARKKGVKAMAKQLKREGFALNTPVFLEAFELAIEDSFQERQADHVERTTASLLRQVLAGFDIRAIPDGVVERALEQLYAASEPLWRPMPGLYEILGELRQLGLRLGIISNAGDENNVWRLLDNANIRSFFEPILVSAAVGIRKPSPRLFEMVLKAWDLPAHRAVMVGDMLGADILGAQTVGLHQIWLTAQADNPENQAQAGFILPEIVTDTLMDVPALILRFDDMEAKD
jgi:HAD superfamily hydrolase (TIGR01549 family)